MFEAWDDYENETYEATQARAVSDSTVDTTMIVGTSEQCAEQIRNIIDIGFDAISIIVYLHRDKIRFWRDFERDVIPLVI